MGTAASRIVVTGLLFLVTLLSGLWLSRGLRLNDPRLSGNPITNGMFAVHKIVALLTVIVAAVTVRKLQKGMEVGHIELAAIIVAGLLFLLMFVSEILLSLGKARNDGIWAVHRVGSLITAIPIAVAIYLLMRGKS